MATQLPDESKLSSNLSDTITPSAASQEPERDETEKQVQLLRKVASAFQAAVQMADLQQKGQYFVVAERSWDETLVLPCETVEALRACVMELRTDLQLQRQKNHLAEVAIYIFHGRQLFLQTWPELCIKDAGQTIPLDPLSNMDPRIDKRGLLSGLDGPPPSASLNSTLPMPCPVPPQKQEEDDDEPEEAAEGTDPRIIDAA